MKIAVYAICMNEEQFVKRFMANLNEADLVVVADTGSTDNTVTLLRALGASVYEINVNPWRFDLPRNMSLALVPADFDVCVCIDLDEVLLPGWRAEIEKAWTPATTRLRYNYVWNTLPDGRPGTTFWYDKIHLRSGYRWVHPVHEVLQYSGTEVQTYCYGFTLYHYPDSSKSRSSYLSLLKLSCVEDPHNDRNSHYLGREFMFYGQHDEAIAELKRHLSLPSAVWAPERCASMRFISRSYLKKGDQLEAQSWALKACAESPAEREPWLELCRVLYQQHNWAGVWFASTQALSIMEKPQSYICEPDAWGGLLYDFASIAAHNLGLKEEAVKMCEAALFLEPDDERLKNNLVQLKGTL